MFGLALHFLMGIEEITAGINFCVKTVLRIGVALLGVLITIHDVSSIGYKMAIVLGFGVCLTILLGVALEVASILSQTKENERYMLMTIVCVTLLSTVAMVCYPITISLFALNPQQHGVFFWGGNDQRCCSSSCSRNDT